MTTKIIGNQLAQGYLDQTLSRQALAHAYLIAGLPGLGKASVVSMMAARLHQLTKLADLAGDPDFKLVQVADDKKDISIEQVREVTEFVKLASWSGRTRIVVIDDAASLNSQAANALLKTLEEPLGQTIIFLITSRPQVLLPTLRSRCQVINMVPVPDDELSPWLKSLGVSDKNIPEYLGLSQGRPGQAYYWFQNQDVLAVRLKLARQYVSFLHGGETLELVAWVEENLFSRGHKSSSEPDTAISNMRQALGIVGIWLEITRDLILCKYDLRQRLAYKALADDLASATGKLTILQLLAAVDLLSQAQYKLAGNANARLTIEWVIISLKGILLN